MHPLIADGAQDAGKLGLAADEMPGTALRAAGSEGAAQGLAARRLIRRRRRGGRAGIPARRRRAGRRSRPQQRDQAPDRPAAR